MRAVDTNVLVRLLVRDDAAQVEKAKAFIAKGAWVSHLALVETVWVLETVYGRSSRQIVEALDLLLGDADLSIQDRDVAARALDRFRKRPAPGFADCLLLEVARKAGHLPLGTFDRNLAKLPDTTRLAD